MGRLWLSARGRVRLARRLGRLRASRPRRIKSSSVGPKAGQVFGPTKLVFGLGGGRGASGFTRRGAGGLAPVWGDASVGFSGAGGGLGGSILARASSAYGAGFGSLALGALGRGAGVGSSAGVALGGVAGVGPSALGALGGVGGVGGDAVFFCSAAHGGAWATAQTRNRLVRCFQVLPVGARVSIHAKGFTGACGGLAVAAPWAMGVGPRSRNGLLEAGADSNGVGPQGAARRRSTTPTILTVLTM